MAQATWQRVQRSSTSLSRKAVQAMEDLQWFAALHPEQRSYVGLVVQSALSTFAQWLRTPGQPLPVGPEVFAAAPRELARAVNLKQTVQLIRIAVGVVEEAVPTLAAPGEADELAAAVLRYSREIAFAAADVYAAAAEARGAWDSRVEAGVVDALVRGNAGDLTLSRAASLGWGRVEWVVALATPVPLDLDLAQLRTHARHSGLSMLSGEAASALVLVLGGSGSVDAAVQQVVAALPDAPVVVGPQAVDLASAAPSVQEALAGLHAVGSWPQAPRPVPAGDLLAERVALGEEAARRRLLEEVYIPLEQAGGDLLLTASAYLEGGGSVERAGRTLFLHPNTVRYRLRKLTELTGLDVTDPRAGLVVRLALLVGRSSAL